MDMSGATAIPLPTMFNPQSRNGSMFVSIPIDRTIASTSIVSSSPLRSFQITAPVTFSSPSTSFSVKYGYFTRTLEERRRWTIASWACHLYIRWQRVTSEAIPSRDSAQSTALFPPPTIRTFFPRSGSNEGRK
ncbi:MAG: hypothetical protein B7Z74_03845 [Deltaproteobacteria bacterium 21-66-5]|nr:MAG: hypothetical protein B7Z74_03845 [Deltaproteobacteria bacterium 21-66-5]